MGSRGGCRHAMVKNQEEWKEEGDEVRKERGSVHDVGSIVQVYCISTYGGIYISTLNTPITMYINPKN